MPKQARKARARALRRKHERQICRHCTTPGATEVVKVRRAKKVGSINVPTVVVLYEHKRCGKEHQDALDRMPF